VLTLSSSDTSSFGTFSVQDPKALALLQNATYTLAAPGPNAARQEAPHLHDAVLDPTKKFLLFPDLGADLVRLFQIGVNNSIQALAPIKAVAGSGPRHAAFATAGGNTYFYTLNELTNSITGYRVAYKDGAAPDFTQSFSFSLHGPGGSSPNGTKAAEIEVSVSIFLAINHIFSANKNFLQPDQKFLIVSSRGENLLKIPNWNATNTTSIPSDPLVSFSIDEKSGNITHVQTAPAGGRNPRGFSLNKAGNLLVSALQDDNRVVVYERDVKTGLLGKVVASAIVGVGADNGPNYALFNE